MEEYAIISKFLTFFKNYNKNFNFFQTERSLLAQIRGKIRKNVRESTFLV